MQTFAIEFSYNHLLHKIQTKSILHHRFRKAQYAFHNKYSLSLTIKIKNINLIAHKNNK